jgi:hypothetical protein
MGKHIRRPTWKAFWIGLPKPAEHFFTVDMFNSWRRHQVWANRNGEELRSIVTQRFASNTVFLSLLTATEMGILFSPSDPAQLFREKLKTHDFEDWGYYAGMFLCFGVFMSICALYTNFVAWGILANIGKENVHAILRSTIGMYAIHLPNRLIVASIYLFFLSFIFLMGILMPLYGALSIAGSFVLLMVHVTSTYSAIGRIIMDTGAMGNAVFTTNEEERMPPYELYEALLVKVKVARKANIPVNRMYRIDYRQSLVDIELGGHIVELESADREASEREAEEAKEEEYDDKEQ